MGVVVVVVVGLGLPMVLVGHLGQQDHPDHLDHQDQLDPLDQMAHQDHWEPQPHHHHHHHHHAQQSVSPSVSQHAQLPVAHRRSIRKWTYDLSYCLEWFYRLLPITIFSHHSKNYNKLFQQSIFI